MSDWPVLDPARDHETLSILHLAAQMLGKIRVAHAPWTNHGWHVALQPNARGLSILPTASGDGRTFTLTLDLCRHAIVLWASDESREELPLNAGSIAALHRRLIAMLDLHGLQHLSGREVYQVWVAHGASLRPSSNFTTVSMNCSVLPS